MVVDRKIKKIVIDTSAFLKNVPLWEFAEEFYCVSDVIKEIKDRATRRYIDSLPIQLQLREPSSSSLKHIFEFTKKTGDYASLSLPDIKVLALTYELEVEMKGGATHLRSEPLKQRIEQIAAPRPVLPPAENAEQIEGFYIPSKKGSAPRNENEENDSLIAGLNSLEVNGKDDFTVNEQQSPLSQDNPCDVQSETNQIDDSDISDNGSDASELDYEDAYPNQEDEEEELLSWNSDTDDDDVGWITPSNIKSLKQNAHNQTPVLNKVDVVCITGDYSVQNVLKHIGLQVMGVDGKVIESVRTFILRCFACFKTTTKMEKIFCPHCGNKTLKRVSVTMNPDGSQRIWISTKKSINVRGMKYRIPRPQGGKHARNPIVVADQREAQERASKLARMKNNPMSDEYDTRSFVSPFLTRDVYSRAAQLGIRSGKKSHQGTYYWEQRNPCEPLKKNGRRKKKR